MDPLPIENLDLGQIVSIGMLIIVIVSLSFLLIYKIVKGFLDIVKQFIELIEKFLDKKRE